jgi:hypothetical protein
VEIKINYMKLKEAKEIVGYILDWQFVCMGIKDREEVFKNLDLSKYSLNDLIRANKIVSGNNKRKEKLAKYHREKGHNVKGYSISTLLADRLIAAVYTAISFPPNGEMIALINDVGVGCVRANYD